MSIDRRSFLVGAAALVVPAQARSAETERGRSITEFGVVPNGEKTNSELFQKAVDEISAAGQPVYVPAGNYHVREIELPPKCAINGDPGRTVLMGAEGIFSAMSNRSLQVSGIVFDGLANDGKWHCLVTRPVRVFGGTIVVRECEFRHISHGAIYAVDVSAIFTMNDFSDCGDAALKIRDARSVLIRQCRFDDCNFPSFFNVDGCLSVEGQDVQINDNFISRCSAGISAEGNGEIRDNTISGPGVWGMKLGGSTDDTQGLSVTGNTITGCDVGIALARGAEWLSVTRNTIAGASRGAIRAFEGKAPTGPDLAMESPGTYPNLGLSGNVVRPSGYSR